MFRPTVYDLSWGRIKENCLYIENKWQVFTSYYWLSLGGAGIGEFLFLLAHPYFLSP